jgi:hypothetical protein
VECVKENNAANRSKNKESIRAQERNYADRNKPKKAAWRRVWNTKNIERTMLTAARKRAKLKNLQFSIDLNDITIPAVCPVLGIKLQRTAVDRSASTPSLERIKPELGYVKGNVLVVSWRANRLKSDASVEELGKLFSFYSQYGT